jgi:hypothetical protein
VALDWEGTSQDNIGCVQASCSFFLPLPRTSSTTGPSVVGKRSPFSLPPWQSLRRRRSRSAFAQLYWGSKYSDSQSAVNSPEQRRASPISIALYLPLKTASSLRTSEGPIIVDSFIMLTLRNVSSVFTDGLFVCPSHLKLETGALKFVSDLPLLYGVEP